MHRTYLFILILFILQSCVISDLQKTEKEYKVNRILNDPAKSYMYKAEINIFDHYFSGLIIIKPKEEGHRIVFMNEIGMKFFDLELTNDSYIVHHIFEAMNKKMFVKLLISDFKHILMYGLNEGYEFFQKNNDTFIVKPHKQKELYYFDLSTSQPMKSEKYSAFRKHTFVNYMDYKDLIPGKIQIEHKNIDFKMNLTFIK